MNTTNHGGSRQGAGPKEKEKRKTLHRNIPVSRYEETAKAIDDWLENYRKEEIRARKEEEGK